MSQIEKNTVPSKNQLNTSKHIFYENQGGAGLRVLFVGNSITLHGYKEDIGWYGKDYGMAASSKEKDYVHLVLKELNLSVPDVSACICQAAEWERGYAQDGFDLDIFKDAKDFDADIIIMRIIENCSYNNFDEKVFEKAYKDLIDYLDPKKKAQVILTTSFWKHIGDRTIEEIGKERNYKTIRLGELGEDEKMKAIGLFEHDGVANHPGDKGMEEIARLILQAIDI